MTAFAVDSEAVLASLTDDFEGQTAPSKFVRKHARLSLVLGLGSRVMA